MEQFTRECLEVDKDVSGSKSNGQGTLPGSANSMEQIYERAARLVKRTLDVQGAVVMDVSHVDVVENISAESSTSITIHSHDPQVGTSHKMLNADEFAKLQDFFSKHPEGKMCEGVLPAGLRPFLPPQIEYALGWCLSVFRNSFLISIHSCPDIQYRQASLRYIVRVQYGRDDYTIRECCGFFLGYLNVHVLVA